MDVRQRMGKIVAGCVACGSWTRAIEKTAIAGLKNVVEMINKDPGP